MGLPLHDWQFWVASAIAAVALLIALRPFLPRRLLGRKATAGPCPGCPSGNAAAAGPKRTAITIEGKRL